jgi:hypothetical protein
MAASMIHHVVEKVVENGEVLRDVDYATIRHGPNQFVVQGFNRDVPFVLTNMSPQALQQVYRHHNHNHNHDHDKNKNKNKNKNKKKKKTRATKKAFKNKTHSRG